MKAAVRFIDSHCNLPNVLHQLKLSPSVTATPSTHANFLIGNSFRELLKTKLESTGFEGCISVSSDFESQQQTLDLMDQVDCVHGAFGIHPLYCASRFSRCLSVVTHVAAADFNDQSEHRILSVMKHPKTVAYGEIGLDYHQFEPHLQQKFAAPGEQRMLYVSVFLTLSFGRLAEETVCTTD